jgi:SpoVK/Ycf46/Vps4 family AAA+-type ATPase
MSAEHGQSQQLVDELLTEYLPAVAGDGRPSLVLLDEVESMAVARSESSLSANPVDVHRATDAVLTAIDELAVTAPHLVFVVTSNFVRGLDEAFLSRADVTIEFPMPNAAALHMIITDVLRGLGERYAPLTTLADDPGLHDIALAVVGIDGRQARKLVSRALAQRIETAVDPAQLTLADLHAAAGEAHDAPRTTDEQMKRVRAA